MYNLQGLSFLDSYTLYVCVYTAVRLSFYQIDSEGLTNQTSPCLLV